jgi:hypothetical protein
MRKLSLPGSATLSLLLLLGVLAQVKQSAQVAAQSGDAIASRINLQGRDVATNALPRPLVLKEKLGITTLPFIEGQIIHHARDKQAGMYETRAVMTPNGDYLLMFPDGKHYGGSDKKTNDMLAYRSKDKGRTWQGPTVAFDIDYNQHGFIPFIPKGSKRLYAFGTQPIWGLYTREHGLHENAPIGFRYSDDDGQHWAEVRLIRPANDPDFKGMSVMRMTETDRGTWLIGSHEADWSYSPLITRQYVLRSEDRGQTWELLPKVRHGGWFARNFGRMDEGRPINLGNDKILMLLRTPEGHLWETRSNDDGKTWAEPKATALIHPDAPPMLFHLSDGKTLLAFHHNRHSDKNYTGLDGRKMEAMRDRSEIWFSLSTDEGVTWSAPRLVFANALAESFDNPFRNYQCSYLDMFIDGGELHLFIPHRWERALYLHFKEADLKKFPTKRELFGE